MLSTILTHPLFIVAVASFLMGSFGYILVRMWFLPVLRYNRSKRLVLAEIRDAYPVDPTPPSAPTADTRKRLRQHSNSLSSTYNKLLPYWYQLLLERRNEDPIQAATILMKLANTRNQDHAKRQIEQIKTCFNMKM